MVLVAALYIAHALSLKFTGHGLSVAWLLLLVLPGALAAHLVRRAGAGAQYSAESEGIAAGVLTATFASLVQVVVFMIGVLNIDWAAYSAQVGPDIGNGVREMVVPAAAVASVVLVAITYAGCTFAGWLGAVAYRRILNS
jgi:hypothetical protein